MIPILSPFALAAAIGLPGFITDRLFGLMMSAIPIGTIVFLVYQWVKRATWWVDELSPGLHRIAVAVIGALLTLLASVTHVPIVCQEGVNCLSALDQNTLTLLAKWALGVLTAYVLHAKKDSAPAR